MDDEFASKVDQMHLSKVHLCDATILPVLKDIFATREDQFRKKQLNHVFDFKSIRRAIRKIEASLAEKGTQDSLSEYNSSSAV